MYVSIRQLLIPVLFLSQFTTFAQNGPPTIEQVRAYMNNPLVSHILNETVNDYPPSLIITSEKDVLRQHGILLAEKLKKAGVPTQSVDLPGVGHLAGDWLSARSVAQPSKLW